MASFKNKFSETAHHVYHSLKQYRKFSCHYKFIDRSKKSENLCIVLAGYKPHLFETVFARLHRYQLSDMDVCIITSGLFSDEIESTCKRYDWSYLSTKENNVSLVQNVAIRLFANAQFIFKLDEDIFITKDYFANMLRGYAHALETSRYQIGVLAPLIPINGFGYVRILEKEGMIPVYEKHFDRVIYCTGPKHMIESNPDTAKFMWGEPADDIRFPSIDELNQKYQSRPLSEIPCPIRFSIGAILFHRDLWEDMEGFQRHFGTSLGSDEQDLCTYCDIKARPFFVTENVVVGHLSFGHQNAQMKEYFETHPERFQIPVEN